MLSRKHWANWPTIKQLIDAYYEFCGTTSSRMTYMGNGLFVEEHPVLRRWGYEIECDIDSVEYSYLDMYKIWCIYTEWEKSGMPVVNDDAIELPF